MDEKEEKGPSQGQKKKLYALMQNTMAEAGEILLDDETYEAVLTNLRETLKVAGVPFSTDAVVAFFNGFQLGNHASDDLGPMSGAIGAGLSRYIREQKGKLKGMKLAHGTEPDPLVP